MEKEYRWCSEKQNSSNSKVQPMYAGIRSDYQDAMKCPFPNKNLRSTIITLVLGQIKNGLAIAN